MQSERFAVIDGASVPLHDGELTSVAERLPAVAKGADASTVVAAFDAERRELGEARYSPAYGWRLANNRPADVAYWRPSPPRLSAPYEAI
jgi:hypothetical protein